MISNKLTELLQTFSSTDKLRFHKYLSSPFFNEQKDLIALYELLTKGPPPGKTEKMGSKLGLWKMLFPSLPFDDVRYRRLHSDLLQLALDFIGYQQYRAHPVTPKIFLLHALAKTRLDKHFNGVARQAEADLEKSGHQDADFHYFRYMLQRRHHEHMEFSPGKDASFQYMEAADYHLDCYYLTKKLEHYCDMLGYQNIRSAAADIYLFPDFLTQVENSPYLKEPSVEAYYLVALMALHPDQEAYFFKLKALVEKQAEMFRKKELQTLFIHLMNFCIYTKINNGRIDYYKELFALYRIALRQEIIFDNGELDPHHYKNIITTSFYVREFAWAENFIQEFTPRLPKADQENALQYNLAQLYFHKGEFKQVIGQLREVEYQTLAYALGSKLLLLRTYFELGEEQALDSLIDSFNIYLRRNKFMSNENKKQYLNAVRFTKKMAAVAPYDKEAIRKIKSQIEACQAVAVKKWLLEKVDAL